MSLKRGAGNFPDAKLLQKQQTVAVDPVFGQQAACDAQGIGADEDDLSAGRFRRGAGEAAAVGSLSFPAHGKIITVGNRADLNGKAEGAQNRMSVGDPGRQRVSPMQGVGFCSRERCGVSDKILAMI